MHVESSAAPRARARLLTPERALRLALASALSLWLIIVSGAAVRLTASGLGCEAWPGCEEGSFFPASGHHSWVEFGNRAVAILPLSLTLLAWLGVRRLDGLPRWVRWTALGTFAGTVAQAPLGLVTIRTELHPLMVMTHFLLALVVLAGGVVVAAEAWSAVRGRGVSPVPPPVRRAGLVLVAACAALVVTGAFATAAGPHPGGEEIHRLGNLVDAMWVHVRATAVFGLMLALVVGWLWRRRSESRLLLPALVLLGLLAVQMVVGEVQWRSRLPWGLVLVHVSLAGAVWASCVFLVHALWRPTAGLARRPLD